MGFLNLTKQSPSKNMRDYSFFVQGPAKTGKTSLVLSIDPDLYDIDVDDGSKRFSVAKTIPKNWPQLCSTVDELIAFQNHENLKGIKTVLLDGMGKAVRYCMDYLCQRKGWEHVSDPAMSKGWKLLQDEFMKPIIKLMDSRYWLWMIGNTRGVDRTFGQTTKTIHSPTIVGSVYSLISAEADVLLFLNPDVTGDRKIYCRSSSSHPAGGRILLPESIPYGKDALINAIEQSLKGDLKNESTTTVR
jgi:hypothetical protein